MGYLSPAYVSSTVVTFRTLDYSSRARVSCTVVLQVHVEMTSKIAMELTRLIRMCGMTQSCVCHDSLTCVTQLIHVRHDSMTYVARLIHVRAMTHSCTSHDSLLNESFECVIFKKAHLPLLPLKCVQTLQFRPKGQKYME